MSLQHKVSRGQAWIGSTQDCVLSMMNTSKDKPVKFLDCQDILLFVLNTKWPLIDVWLRRYKQKSFGC